MPYTPDEQARLQALTEAEATLIDAAKFAAEAPNIGDAYERDVTVSVLLRYARTESLSADCIHWLEAILDASLFQ